MRLLPTLLVTALVICLSMLSLATSSVAQTLTCNVLANRVRTAERNLIAAENSLVRAENNYYNLQNSLSLQQANLEAGVAQAQANYDTAGNFAAGNAAGCIISGFFGVGRIGGCVGNGISASVGRRAAAEARLRAAQGRLQSFTTYSQNRLYREALRVTQAQQLVATREEDLRLATAAYLACEASVVRPGSGPIR